MQLSQDKLDVLEKTRSNLFNWRGQFTPEFIEYLLHEFSERGNHILDPFSGSGTVLQEAARSNLKATGFEINPAAYAMSKFFTFCNLTFKERHDLCNNFVSTLENNLEFFGDLKLYNKDSDYRLAYHNLLQFAQRFGQTLTDKREKIIFLNILFQSEKDKGLTVRNSIIQSFKYIKNALLQLPYTQQEITALLKDSRCAGEDLKNQIDLIITSPPYINVFNYHQNFRAIIEIFHFDILKVAQSEFGANRKHRSNRFKTVIQYCLDMELAIRGFWYALKPNSKLILVLGRESNVMKIPFYNGQLVIDILEKSNGFSNIKILERKFLNKFGVNIKEDIIITTKCDNISNNFNAKEIALKHLENNLKVTQDGVKEDIENAIKEINEVTPSPFFNSKEVILHE